MTKHHFDNAGVCHAWANKSADWGRGSHARIYFDGTRIYSYGNHFLIAGLLPGGLALFNSASYSVSTGQHQRHAQNAARHLARFTIPDPADLLDILERAGIIDRLQDAADGKRPRPWTSSEVWRSEGETPLAAARRWILRYIRDNAGALDGLRESVPFRTSWERASHAPDPAPEVEARLFPVWLLGLVGLGAGTWRKISAADTKQRAKAKADAERMALANLIMNAKGAADRPESSFLEALARNAELPRPCSAWEVQDRIRIVSETATKWRRLHRVAKRNLSARRTAKIWGRVKIMAAEIKRLEAIERRINVRQGVGSALAKLRGRGQVSTGSTLTAWGKALVAIGDGQAAYVMAHDNVGLVFSLVQALEVLAGPYAPEGLGGGIKARAAENLALLAPFSESIAAVSAAEAEAAAVVRREKEVARQAEARRAWLAGEPGARFYGQDEKGGAYLRAIDVAQEESGEITGGQLQTSQGAEVPLAEAFRAFRFLKFCRAAGQGWEANGQSVRVGHFRIESIAPNGDFRAACHFIRWEEVARLADSLGVLGYAADDSAIELRGAA